MASYQVNAKWPRFFRRFSGIVSNEKSWNLTNSSWQKMQLRDVRLKESKEMKNRNWHIKSQFVSCWCFLIICTLYIGTLQIVLILAFKKYSNGFRSIKSPHLMQPKRRTCEPACHTEGNYFSACLSFKLGWSTLKNIQIRYLHWFIFRIITDQNFPKLINLCQKVSLFRCSMFIRSWLNNTYDLLEFSMSTTSKYFTRCRKSGKMISKIPKLQTTF